MHSRKAVPMGVGPYPVEKPPSAIKRGKPEKARFLTCARRSVVPGDPAAIPFEILTDPDPKARDFIHEACAVPIEPKVMRLIQRIEIPVWGREQGNGTHCLANELRPCEGIFPKSLLGHDHLQGLSIGYKSSSHEPT